jgi:hypothetical protein
MAADADCNALESELIGHLTDQSQSPARRSLNRTNELRCQTEALKQASAEAVCVPTPMIRPPWKSDRNWQRVNVLWALESSVPLSAQGHPARCKGGFSRPQFEFQLLQR